MQKHEQIRHSQVDRGFAQPQAPQGAATAQKLNTAAAAQDAGRGRDRDHAQGVAATGGYKKLSTDLECTAVLSFARGHDGRMAVQLEIDGELRRGGPDMLGKRDATVELMRAVDDFKKLVAAPIGRGRR